MNERLIPTDLLNIAKMLRVRENRVSSMRHDAAAGPLVTKKSGEPGRNEVLENPHHAEDLERHKEEENENGPDEVLGGGFDGFACHGDGGD